MPITPEMRKILDLARRSNASDIHIVAQLPPLFRINGEIITANSPPLGREDTCRMALGIMNDEQRQVFERDWQMCCSLYDQELGRFRVSVYYHARNPELSIRPVNQKIHTRDELRLPEQIEDFSRLTSGLILITGPTGSGKTTTLNYMVDLINSERRCKIITIEDPVEYIHSWKKSVIVQQELYTDVKTFSSALVHVLRQNPDIICVGEMRDYETTATALMAAETGHLVIATCHTSNSQQTVERIVSLFSAEEQPQIIAQLANSLHGIVAQRLITSTNRKQRVLATELLIMNPAARNLVRESQFHILNNVIQTNRKVGMHRLDDSLLELYEAGEITYDIALNNSQDPVALKTRIHGNGATV